MKMSRVRNRQQKKIDEKKKCQIRAIRVKSHFLLPRKLSFTSHIMLSLSRLIAVSFVLLQLTNALHFYVRTGETKCFFEELQRDTLVVGKIDAYEKDDHSNEYSKNGKLRVQITIVVCIYQKCFFAFN